MEHPKDGKTYAEVEPEVEYFVRIEVEWGTRVVARIYVDGKYLGYNWKMGSQNKKKSSENGLCSFDGVSSTYRALKFAKAKVLDSTDNTKNLLF